MLAIIDSGFSCTKLLIINESTVIKAIICNDTTIMKSELCDYRLELVVLFGIRRKQMNELMSGMGLSVKELDEIQCSAHICEHYNLSSGYVVSYGSGMNITYYDGIHSEFLTGTGFASVSLQELYRLIFPKNTFQEVLEMAENGVSQNINIEADEFGLELSGWFREKTTIINLGRQSDDKNDIALGILRIFIDNINSVIRGILYNQKKQKIILTGGIFKNMLINDMLRYNFYDLDYIVCQDAIFGAGIGAYYLCCKIDGKHVNKKLEWKV